MATFPNEMRVKMIVDFHITLWEAIKLRVAGTAARPLCDHLLERMKQVEEKPE